MAGDMDSRAFDRSVQLYVKKLSEDAVNAVIAAGYEAKNDAINRTPVDTGRLRASWAVDVERDRDGVTVTTYNSAGYAAHVEYGTRRTRPQPMIRPAFERAAATLRNRLKGL
jgi:HK97 gp10 family phage protein